MLSSSFLSQTKIIVSPLIDLNQYPTQSMQTFGHHEQITVPDTHANPLLMINFLISFGYLKLMPKFNTTETKESLYSELYQINLTGESLTLLQTKRFTEILMQSQWNNQGAIRWLGDCLCDRGSNDRLTLELFKIIHLKEVHFHILLSNHDIEFLKIYFFIKQWHLKQSLPLPTITDSFTGYINQFQPLAVIKIDNYLYNYDFSFNDFSPLTQLYLAAGGNPVLANEHFSSSSFALLRYLDRLTADERHSELETIQNIVDKVYIKQLKLCELSLGNDLERAILYSHAPTSLDVIESLIKHYLRESLSPESTTALDCCFNNAMHLKNTLETLNQHFSQDLLTSSGQRNFLMEHTYSEELMLNTFPDPIAQISHLIHHKPQWAIAWLRAPDGGYLPMLPESSRKTLACQIPIVNIHGHDGNFYQQDPPPPDAKFSNLTLHTRFGQYPQQPDFQEGEFIVQLSTPMPIPICAPNHLTLFTHLASELIDAPLLLLTSTHHTDPTNSTINLNIQ